jgi:predicted DNA-binding antitoxin AbrB/MazE fold protein
MTRTIPAIFDAGVFRPLEPVELAEGTQVVVQVQVPTPVASHEVDAETKQAWHDYLGRMELLPDNSPSDGPTNRDHDKLLYGAP